MLPCLLPGLSHRRVSSAAAVQAAHPPLGHPGPSQRGQAVGVLRVGRPAGEDLLHHTGAGVRVVHARPGVWHQRRGGQGDHLHPAGPGQTRPGAPQGAGHHHLTAGPHHVPEHLHHLHLHLSVPLLSCLPASELTVDFPGNPGPHADTHGKVDVVMKRICWRWKLQLCLTCHSDKVTESGQTETSDSTLSHRSSF